MWSKYTKTPDAVVVQSRVGLLDACLPSTVQIASIIYKDQDVARPEWHSLAPFFYKNPQFKNENELRLITSADLEEAVDYENDIGRELLVNLSSIIERVIIHPNARKKI